MKSKAQKQQQKNVWNSESKDDAEYTSEAQKKKTEVSSDLKQDSMKNLGKGKEVKV